MSDDPRVEAANKAFSDAMPHRLLDELTRAEWDVAMRAALAAADAVSPAVTDEAVEAGAEEVFRDGILDEIATDAVERRLENRDAMTDALSVARTVLTAALPFLGVPVAPKHTQECEDNSLLAHVSDPNCEVDCTCGVVPVARTPNDKEEAR